jgi:hypothetical protein
MVLALVANLWLVTGLHADENTGIWGTLKNILASAVLVQAPADPEVNTAPKPFQAPESLRGIYMTAEVMMSEKMRNGLIDKLVSSGGNAVVINIQHDGGLLAFRPKNEALFAMNRGDDRLDDLPQIIESLHEKGIYVIARQVVFNSPYMASKRPEWRIKAKRGGYYAQPWLDPSLPEVQDYNLSIERELAELGFDEVQFDYIRFPAIAHRYYDYSYDETKSTRSDIILDFLKKARVVADESGIALGADVFGVIVWGDEDWQTVGQNPIEIAQVVDAIYPMTYPSHFGNDFNGHPNLYNAPYGIVYDSIRRFLADAGGRAQIRPWIQGFPLKVSRFGTWYMQEQVKAAYDAGANDFIIWSPGNRYTYSWPVLSTMPKGAAAQIPTPQP